jgi:hypothetical protein
MKTTIFTLAALAALAACSTAFAGSDTGSKAATQIVYNEPEKFTDFRMSESRARSESESLQHELNRAIERSAERVLPPGYVLNIRFTDIDLAGDVNPFQRAENRDVREYRSVYPPRLTFDYSVTDTQGNVVLSGSERLVDLAYDMKLRTPNSDYTRIEAELLRDFIHGLGRKIEKGHAQA